MEIIVTKEHVEKARVWVAENKRAGYCNNCPIALSIRERLKDTVKVQVTYGTIWIGKAQIRIPEQGRKFIALFDTYKYDELERLLPFRLQINSCK